MRKSTPFTLTNFEMKLVVEESKKPELNHFNKFGRLGIMWAMVNPRFPIPNLGRFSKMYLKMQNREW